MKINIKHKKILLVFIALLLILIAGFRPLEYFFDTNNYLIMIKNDNNIFNQEPTFWIINKFNQLVLGGYNQIFFLIYAILGVTTKIIAIKRYSLYPLLSIYFYICLYLILHDMTQIRVGVASGIFLLSLKDIKNKDAINYYTKAIIAILFHYSAIVMLPIYFLNTKNINRLFYIALPFLGFLLYFFQKEIMIIILESTNYLPNFLSNKINQYIYALKRGVFSDFNILSTYYLSILFIYYISIFNVIKLKSPYDILLLKILGIGIFAYSSLSVVPTFSLRISAFFYIVLIILLANFISAFKQKVIVALFMLIWTSYYLFLVIKNSTLLLT